MQAFTCYPFRHRAQRAILMAGLLAAFGCRSTAGDGAAARAPGLAPWFSTGVWSTRIPHEPQLEPNSRAIVAAALVAHAKRATLANDDKWGIAYVEAGRGAKMYQVRCLKWCSEQREAVKFRIPRGARPNRGDDYHLSVIDGDSVLDMYNATYDEARDEWSAYSRVVHRLGGDGVSCQGERCLGATASGFALLAGALRPEEIAAGRIEHALVITTPHTRQGLTACPATHTDGRSASPDSIPIGARIQLDPAFDVDEQSWPAWKKMIARALQEYGAYVADTGGSLSIRGVGDQNTGNFKWAAAHVPEGWREGALLNDLPWERMRVLKIRACD
jgi:hypothetical protein